MSLSKLEQWHQRLESRSRRGSRRSVRHSQQRMGRAQATTLVRVATLGVEAAEGAKCPPDTIVESAKWCTEQVNPAYQPLVVPRGVPSDGADKGGVSPLLLVEGGLVSDTFLEVANHRISLMQEAFGGVYTFGMSRSLELIWARGQRSVSEGESQRGCSLEPRSTRSSECWTSSTRTLRCRGQSPGKSRSQRHNILCSSM